MAELVLHGHDDLLELRRLVEAGLAEPESLDDWVSEEFFKVLAVRLGPEYLPE